MTDRRSRSGPFDTGGRAIAEQGVVLFEGPSGVAVTLTFDAAEATGESLIDAARLARDQSAIATPGQSDDDAGTPQIIAMQESIS